MCPFIEAVGLKQDLQQQQQPLDFATVVQTKGIYYMRKFFGIGKELLTHKLLLDPSFKLDNEYSYAGGGNYIHSEGKLVLFDMLENVICRDWEDLFTELAVAPYSHALLLNVLSNIKSVIQTVAAFGFSEQGHEIAQVINIDLISSRMADARSHLDVMEFDNVLSAIVEVIVKLQVNFQAYGAPMRDETTDALWKEARCGLHESVGGEQAKKARSVCDALKLIERRFNLLCTDVGDIIIRTMTPNIVARGVTSERDDFDRKLAAGTVTLDHTKEWVKYTVENQARMQDQRVSIDSLTGGGGCYDAVMRVALIDLVVEHPQWNGGVRGGFPETLLLDRALIKALNNVFHTDVMCTVVLMTVDQVSSCISKQVNM
jgi:hypothetical protein